MRHIHLSNIADRMTASKRREILSNRHINRLLWKRDSLQDRGDLIVHSKKTEDLKGVDITWER